MTVGVNQASSMSIFLKMLFFFLPHFLSVIYLETALEMHIFRKAPTLTTPVCNWWPANGFLPLVHMLWGSCWTNCKLLMTWQCERKEMRGLWLLWQERTVGACWLMYQNRQWMNENLWISVFLNIFCLQNVSVHFKAKCALWHIQQQPSLYSYDNIDTNDCDLHPVCNALEWNLSIQPFF